MRPHKQQFRTDRAHFGWMPSFQITSASDNIGGKSVQHFFQWQQLNLPVSKSSQQRRCLCASAFQAAQLADRWYTVNLIQCPRIPAIARGPVENCNLPPQCLWDFCYQFRGLCTAWLKLCSGAWQHGFGMPAAIQKGGRISGDPHGGSVLG